MMFYLRVLAITASVSLLPTAAHAEAVVDEPLAGADVPVTPTRPLKAPEIPEDFLVETRGFLRVVYHPSSFEAVRQITTDADAARASLATTLGQSVLDSVEVRVARTPDEMALLAPSDAPPAAHTTGASYPSLGLIVLSVRKQDGGPTVPEDAFRHQLAHVALFDAASGRPLPRWLQEGFAVYATGESTVARAHILWTSHVRRRFVSFSQLDTFPEDPASAKVAWTASADFVRFLARDRDGTRFAAAIARTRSGGPLDRALVEAYGTDLRGLEQSWREDVGSRCVTIPLTIGAVAGWGAALLAFVARRRRKRRIAERREAAAIEPTIVEPSPRTRSQPRLLMCDRGLGHVVYIVERKPVPNVEHDGKRHTLH
jgi:hypothetical protein